MCEYMLTHGLLVQFKLLLYVFILPCVGGDPYIISKCYCISHIPPFDVHEPYNDYPRIIEGHCLQLAICGKKFLSLYTM